MEPKRVGRKSSKKVAVSQVGTERAGGKPVQSQGGAGPVLRISEGVAYEYKVRVEVLRECGWPAELTICDNPKPAAEYWRRHISTHPYFDPERECLVVLLLDARNRIKGHQLVCIGTKDMLPVSTGEVFRGAIAISASSIVVMHNHPSGDCAPSETDLGITRALERAGECLRIWVHDYIIMGTGLKSSSKDYVSLRTLGHVGSGVASNYDGDGVVLHVYRSRSAKRYGARLRWVGTILPPKISGGTWSAVDLINRCQVGSFNDACKARHWFLRRFGRVLLNPKLLPGGFDASGEEFFRLAPDPIG